MSFGKSLISFLVGLSFLFLIAGVAPAEQTTVSIPGDQLWTNTGVSLTIGDAYSVTASGTICHTDPCTENIGPDGTGPVCNYCYLSSAPKAALIGRVGTGGASFLVGSNFSGTASSSGTLYLGVNESYGVTCGGGLELCDNSGSWTAVIVTPDPVPAVIQVDIDIRPYSEQNCICLNGRGLIPVAIFGSAELNVRRINTSTLTLAGMSVATWGRRRIPRCSLMDINRDGILDLYCMFNNQPANWSPVGSTATLRGRLWNGTTRIEGSDQFCLIGAWLTLSLNRSGDGTGRIRVNNVVRNLPAVLRVRRDSEVTLLAMPGTDSTFVQWTGDLSGSSNPATIEMDQNKSITAEFAHSSPCGFNSQFTSDSSGWVPGKGTWYVANGYYTTIVPPWASGDAGCFAHYDASYTDFTFETRMRSLDQAPNGHIGIYFRGDPAPHSGDPNRWESGYVFQIQQARPDEGYCLLKYDGPDSNSVWIVPWQVDELNLINANDWNTLKVVVVGESITCYLNDVQVISVTDSSLASGYAGLKAGSTVGQSATFEVDWAVLTCNGD